MSAAPTMAVVVVNFNTAELLRGCLASVLAATQATVVVVDNASTDGSAALVRDEFPTVELIANAVNEGYGRAANRGIAACDTPSVLVLNSDTEIADDAVASLGSYLDAHPRAAVVGPRLTNRDGTLQRSTYPFPSAFDVFLGESGLHLAVRRIPWLRDQFLRTWAHDRPRRVPWVLGAALAIRRSAFDAVGGFDDDFFLYSEEVDLCRRLAEQGFETHFAPVTTIRHVGGASTSQRAGAMRRELIMSQRRYLRRHASRSTVVSVLRTLEAIIALRYTRDSVRARFAREPDEKLRHTAAANEERTLLAERALWRA